MRINLLIATVAIWHQQNRIILLCDNADRGGISGSLYLQTMIEVCDCIWSDDATRQAFAGCTVGVSDGVAWKPS